MRLSLFFQLCFHFYTNNPFSSYMVFRFWPTSRPQLLFNGRSYVSYPIKYFTGVRGEFQLERQFIYLIFAQYKAQKLVFLLCCDGVELNRKQELARSSA